MKRSRADTAEDVNEDDIPQLPHVVGCHRKAPSIPESDDEGSSEPKDDLQDLDADSVWDSLQCEVICIISNFHPDKLNISSGCSVARTRMIQDKPSGLDLRWPDAPYCRPGPRQCTISVKAQPEEFQLIL